MQIFRTCFTPKEKARKIFRALFFLIIKFASLAMALAFLSCFLKPVFKNYLNFLGHVSK